MNSYNHYAFGSVMAWVYRRVSGIDTDGSQPGFHHIVIAPQTEARLPHARTEYDSPYGTIVTDWTRSSDGKFRLSVSIPPNTTATVHLPKGKATMDGVPLPEQTVEVGSGTTGFNVR